MERKFAGWDLTVLESRPEGEGDLSRTAEVLIGYLRRKGAKLLLDPILVRNACDQIERLQIPEEHVWDHLYAVFILKSPDHKMRVEIVYSAYGGDTNMAIDLNGRRIMSVDLTKAGLAGIKKIISVLTVYDLA